MSALQELLNLGLVDIGSDDTRFEKVQKAAKAFADKISEEPELLIPATIIALNEKADEATPLFDLVEKLLIDEWRTLRNTHTNRPRELLRAIIIDTLVTKVEGNPEIASVVFNTAYGVSKFKQTQLGKGANIIEDLIKRAGETAELKAVKQAGMSNPSVKKRRRKKSDIDAPNFVLSAKVKNNDLITDVERAAGPSNQQGQAAPDPNPHWTNSHQNWSYEFAPRMTDALVKGLNLANQNLSKQLSEELLSYLSAFDEQLKSEVNEAVQLCREVSSSVTSSNMRLEILWWAEALYSPFLGCSYRDLNTSEASIAAAIDLADIVPPLSPASVYYVLGETIYRINRVNNGKSELKISSYLEKLQTTEIEFGASSYELFKKCSDLPLLGLICRSLVKDSSPDETSALLLNIDGSLEISSGEFAMWIFRELQTIRLIQVLKS